MPVKLAALACALVGTCAVAAPGAAGFLSLASLGHLALQRRWRLAVKGAVLVGILGGLLALVRFAGLHLVVFSEFYVLMFWNLSPVFLVAWDLVTTPPGELSAFLSRVRAPRFAILGTLVVFRFFPTMRTALADTWASMRNRGLASGSAMAAHLLRTCEYVAVPLLLRCLQVADSLAASAVARGAEAPGVRGSYHARPFGAADVARLAFWLAAVAVLLTVGGVK